MNKRGIKMRIALIGYGKMGKLLHTLCSQRGFEVVSIIDKSNITYNKNIDKESLNGAEVALEFTQPEGVIKRVRALAQYGVNIVIGTSGWYEKIEEVENLAIDNKIGIIYGANFSIGMNLFFQAIDYLSKMMAQIPDYDLYAYEEHHNMKKDRPSGTAKYITSLLKKNQSNISPNFEFESIRAGKKPGTHLVGYDGEFDFIELKHLARERSAFVSGALKSAQWLDGKRGFYNYSDYFKEIFGIDE